MVTCVGYATSAPHRRFPTFAGSTADSDIICIKEIETAYGRMQKSDVKDRFVIDMATMPAAA